MKTLIVISLLTLTACGNFSLGNSSKSDSDNDNSNTVITTNDNDDVGIDPAICFAEQPTKDGPNGFTWKPVSERDGLPVILFPEKFFTEFISVTVGLTAGGKETATFAGRTNPNRLTYRLSKSASNYNGVISADTESVECVWKVPDATKRED